MGKGMKAGKKAKAPKPGMPNMAQLQAMQAQMTAAQEKIEETEMEASAGGGAVAVKVNGKHQVVSVKIDPEVMDDVEMLQDLILAATNEAMRQIDELSENEMNRLTGGMNLGF